MDHDKQCLTVKCGFLKIVFVAFLSAVLPTASLWAASLENYGALPSIDDMAISPDATKNAYVTGSPSRRTLVVQDLKTGKLLRGFKIDQVKLRGIRWAGINDLLIETSITTNVPGLSGPIHEWSSITDYSLDQGIQFQLLHDDVPSVQLVRDAVAGAPQIREVDGRTMVFVAGIYFPGRLGQRGLFRIDLSNHRTTFVDPGDRATRGWVVATDGRVMARDEYDEATRMWTLNFKQGSDWVARYSVSAPIDIPSLDGLDPSGDGVLARIPDAEGVHLLDVPAEPVRQPTIFAEHAAWIIHAPITGRPIALVNPPEYRFLDGDDQRFWNGIKNAFDGEVVDFVSRSAGGEVVIVRVEGSKDGAAYMYVDHATRHASWIADFYDGLTPNDLSPVRAISYPAADGLTIPAFLTLPRGRDAKGLPLVVFPHGGPQVHDRLGFDWWAQAMAAQGYAVLQPQFRGSTGFGERFQEAGYGEWGRKMQTDLSDGVRFLAKDGTIDPARVCIVGASYGGYAALAGAAFDPGVYRCAVSVAGPADLALMLKYEERKLRREDSSLTRFWMRDMGAKSSDDPSLAQISPALHADRINIPVLLIHGEDDTVVEYKQSKIMKRALEDAGKPVTLITLDGEDHWLSRAETRVQMLKATVDFLKAHNPA